METNEIKCQEEIIRDCGRSDFPFPRLASSLRWLAFSILKACYFRYLGGVVPVLPNVRRPQPKVFSVLLVYRS